MDETPIRAVGSQSNYLDKLIKLIPGEIIGTFVFIQSVCKATDTSDSYQFGSALALLVLTPFYLRFAFGIKNWIQILATMISFAVWVYSVAGDHVIPKYYTPVLSAILLSIWTLIIPVIPNSTLASK